MERGAGIVRAAGRGRRLAAHLACGRGGNIATIFALILPVVVVTSLGGVELQQVLSDKRRTQDVADSAALMGAAQLAVTPSGAGARAQAFAQSQLPDVANYATVTSQATAGANNTMTVAVDTQRASFFGDLLPPGGFHTHVSSTAQGQNTAPLCVLNIGGDTADNLHVTGLSQIQAGQCLVHSNSSLVVDPAANLSASANEAATTASGAITQAPSLGAPAIADPFASLNVNAACAGTGAGVTYSTPTTIQPQTFTGPVNINGGDQITLAPGVYYFCKTLTISGAVAVTGLNVALVFANGAGLSFGGLIPVGMGPVSLPIGPSLNLTGRQTGSLAGFTLIADRTYTGSFQLQSDYITGLTGTIYIPTATLQVQGTALSGSTTPWTVITAKSLQVNGGARLVINANYAATNVPVPSGVGDQRTGGGAKLTQ